jgi:hypothetical protein
MNPEEALATTRRVLENTDKTCKLLTLRNAKLVEVLWAVKEAIEDNDLIGADRMISVALQEEGLNNKGR